MSVKGQKGERMCVVCRTHTTPDKLIRIVNENGTIKVDFSGKANGRGAYVCKSLQCAELCKKRGSLNSSFKTVVDSSIYDTIIESLQDN